MRMICGFCGIVVAVVGGVDTGNHIGEEPETVWFPDDMSKWPVPLPKHPTVECPNGCGTVRKL